MGTAGTETASECELSLDETHLLEELRCLISTVKLTGFRIAMETNLWARLEGIREFPRLD